MKIEDLSPMARKVVDSVSGIIEEIKSIGKLGWDDLPKLLELVNNVVEAVENNKELATVSGSVKKAVALEIIEYVIDMVNLKFLPFWVPQSFVKSLFIKLLSILIDYVVKLFNEKGIFKHK